MTAPITSHVFRPITLGANVTGERGGIRPGMCAYLGTCNRPKADHARTRGNGSARTLRAQR